MYFRPFIYKDPPHLGSSMRSRPKRRRRRKARGCPRDGGCGCYPIRIFGWWQLKHLTRCRHQNWFQSVLFLNLKFGEMIQFDGCIFFQMGWFNHQLGIMGSQVTGGLEIQETYPKPSFWQGPAHIPWEGTPNFASGMRVRFLGNI